VAIRCALCNLAADSLLLLPVCVQVCREPAGPDDRALVGRAGAAARRAGRHRGAPRAEHGAGGAQLVGAHTH
jgi:hypothetical protein